MIHLYSPFVPARHAIGRPLPLPVVEWKSVEISVEILTFCSLRMVLGPKHVGAFLRF